MTRAINGLLAAVILLTATNLAAQSPSKTNAELIQPFMGHWVKDGRLMNVGGQWFPFDQRTACGPEAGGAGRCSIPLDKMKSHLHPRMLAWMQFAGLTDERLSGMF